MKYLVLTGLCVLMSLCTAAAQQDGVYLGVTGGYSFGVPLTVARDPGVVNRYFGVTLRGTSEDHLGWAGAAFLAPSLFGDRLGLSADVSLALSSGSFFSNQFAFDSLYIPADVRWVQGLYTVELSTLLSMLQFDIQARYRLSNRLAIGLGPWFTARLSSGIFQQENLVGTLPAVTDFTGVERTRIVAAGKPLASSVLRGGLMGSLSYTIPLARGMDLALSPHARLDLAALGDNIDLLRSMRAGMGLSLMFSVSDREPLPQEPEEPDTTVIRDTLIVYKEPELQKPLRKPVLEATIDLYSRDNTREQKEAVIRRISTYFRQSSELSPVVFFDSNSVAIPERYTLLSAAEAQAFSTRSLARLTPIDVYYRMLNIIGMRLRENPAAQLVLTGSVSAGEPQRLAIVRCEQVRKYFREVWQIDDSRIAMRSAGEGRGRTVVLSSPSPVVLAPVVLEWKIRELAAPSIRLVHTVQAQAGVRNWVLVLTHGGKRVGYHTGESLQELDVIDLSFQINGRFDDAALEPLRAELTVEDYTGESLTVHAELPLVWEHIADGIPVSGTAADREKVSAVLFPSSADATPQRSTVLRELLTSVRDGAYVTIASLTGGDLSDEHLLLRPDRVAEALLAALKERDVQVAELHIERRVDYVPPTLSSLPEGDLFRSAVSVTIEQQGRR